MSIVFWPKICGNSSNDWAYWNDNLTWNTPTPDLTLCFQKTVLQWIPNGLLWILSLVYIPYLIKRPQRTRARISGFNLCKQIPCIFLIIIAIMNLTHAATNNSKPTVLYLHPIIEILTMLLTMFLIRFEYKKVVHSSGVLFFFWFISLIDSLLILASQSLRIQNGKADIFLATVSILTGIITLLQFLLHCFADNSVFRQRERHTGNRKERQPLISGAASSSSSTETNSDSMRLKKPCPELHASFLSRLTFTWLTPLVIRGYQRALTASDLWDLRPIDRCSEILPKIEKYWKKQLAEVRQKNGARLPYSSVYHYSNGGYDDMRMKAKDKDDSYDLLKEIRVANREGTGKHKPNIMKTLLSTFGPYYGYIGFIKLITDLINFAQPQILKQLIGFLAEENDYVWHGFLFAFSLFFVAMVRTIIFQHYWNGCYLTGMRLRTAVIGVVYRKALRLSGSSRKDTTVGEIVNLMSVDAQKLQDAPGFLHIVWTAPITIIVAIVFLWQELGPSALAGVFIMIILMPINGVIASKVKKLQVAQMRLKDQRIKLMNEILSGVKVLKLYAWEESFMQKINEIRDKELVVLRSAAYLNAFSSMTWFCAPFLVSLTTFAVYVLSSPENVLTSQKAFVSLSLFNIMNFPLALLPGCIAYLVQLIVSVSRINRYLTEEELDPKSVEHNPLAQHAIEIIDGTFVWDQESDPVLSNIDIAIPDGKLYAVVGTVGAGKSSLINAILGELLKRDGRVIVKGSTAYVPQQAWCQNCSLQDNILFGRNMHRNKYNRIIDACALRPDLKVLAAGDKTEIGEKGINLSGGQKQRISLARAVYHDCDIYLLDDPLSAVDSHVGKHLFEQVISSNGLLANKTRILVTHGLHFLPKVDCIIVLKDGVISEMGTYQELLSHNGAFADYIRTYLEKEEEEEEEEDEDEELVHIKTQLRRTVSVLSGSESESELQTRSRKSLTGSKSFRSSASHHRRRSSMMEDLENLERQQKEQQKLMTEETSETGGVKFAVFWAYIKAVTGLAFVGLIGSYALYITCQVSTNIWLSIWSEDTTSYNDTSVRDLYLGVYGALGAGQSIFILIQSLSLAYGTFYASRSLHVVLLKNIMKTPMSFFDTTPLGRILNRFGKDVDTVDLNIPMTIRATMATAANVIATLIVVSIASPIFLIALIPLGICYHFVQRFYICTSRQLKRIDSVKRSPIYSHFQESVVGATSIRAYEQNNEFIFKSDRLVDENQMVWYPNIISFRWLGFFLESIGNIVILLAGIFAVLSRYNVGPGIAAASVTYALQVTGSLNFMVRMTCDLENYIVAVERILEYAHLPIEAPWFKKKQAGALWPARGEISFQNYSVRYRPGLELVLKNINLSINPGEMVGIVGRTGAGKSSLTMALFRILEPASGTITIDGVDITSIGLQELRSRLTIIPQDPVLFSGTLRMNLDPSDSHSDGQIWSALEQAHLKEFVSSLADGLQHKCSEGGENLSVGQRQLVCLARALLRKTKVLVLDEATAAVDLETDDLIQNTIRREFKGCTILTIAHRLNTIMDYDRIAVLDRGDLKEFDSPNHLLSNTKTIFHGMCRDAGLA